MASALQILQNTFGVKAIAPTDPGIIKLADIRSGFYPGLGDVQITPTSLVQQYYGQIPDPLKLYAAKDPNPFLDTTLPRLLGIGAGLIGGPAAAIAVGAANYVDTAAQRQYLAAFQERSKMAYYDPTTGGWTETPSAPPSTGSGPFGLSDIFGGSSASDWLGLLSKGLDIYSTTLGPATRAVTTAGGTAVGGMMVGGARAVGSALFRRFPNLAAGLNALKMAGKNYATRSRLYSLLKRFGPDVLITGGILSAAAVSELMIAGPGRRRMNPANVKALRRAHRRMASFHHICRKNDTLMHRGSRRRAPASSAVTRITQVK